MRRAIIALAALGLLAASPPEKPSERPLSRIAFGSCLGQDLPQPIWKRVLAVKPDVFVFLGDNVYSDTDDEKRLRAAYAKLAAQPGFQQLRKSTRILATWDDHDYGTNDSGGDFPAKAMSQQVFLDFFGVAEGLAAAGARRRVPRRDLRAARQARPDHPPRHAVQPQPAGVRPGPEGSDRRRPICCEHRCERHPARRRAVGLARGAAPRAGAGSDHRLEHPGRQRDRGRREVGQLSRRNGRSSSSSSGRTGTRASSSSPGTGTTRSSR